MTFRFTIFTIITTTKDSKDHNIIENVFKVMEGFLHFCLRFFFLTSAVLSEITQPLDVTMSQLHLKLDSRESKVGSISDEIRTALESSSGLIDDLYLTFNLSDLNDVNGEIIQLHEHHKIKRHHMEFSNNLSLDSNEIQKYASLLRLSGLSVTLKNSNDIVQLFSILHVMTNLQTVKLSMGFETTENIDIFYDSTLREFPLNAVEQLSINRFLPYAFMFKVIRAFIQQSPHLNRIILYSPLTPNALQHFRSQYVSEIETLVQKPLTIYVRPIDGSVVEEQLGLVLFKSLSSVEESQFENECPFYVKKMNTIRPDDAEL